MSLHLADGLGSIRQIVDVTGTVIENYDYDPYGKPNVVSAVGNPIMFTGRWLDKETGNYYYRARQYSPLTGRFLQRDPLKNINLVAKFPGTTLFSMQQSEYNKNTFIHNLFFSKTSNNNVEYFDGVNQYHYVGNNAINQKDPSGLISPEDCYTIYEAQIETCKIYSDAKNRAVCYSEAMQQLAACLAGAEDPPDGPAEPEACIAPTTLPITLPMPTLN